MLTASAIFSFLGPLLLPVLKQFLPVLLGRILNAIFDPPTPADKAVANLSEAVVEGDLMELTKTTQLIIDSSGQDNLTDTNIDNMLKLVP